MPVVFNALPARFEDGRHIAIIDGFIKHGYRVVTGAGFPESDADVMVTWTVHHGAKERARDEFERRGGSVLVCEESYIKMPLGEKHIAMAWHDHQGAGAWFVGDDRRLDMLVPEIQQRRVSAEDDYILVREQRGIGSALQRCPPSWHLQMMARIKPMTTRRVIERKHPKMDPDKTPDEQRLASAHALVTWNSSMMAQAMIMGVPVFACAPHTVADPHIHRDLTDLPHPKLTDRIAALTQMAWAQFSLTEIRNGAALSYLLSVPVEARRSARLQGDC